MENLKLGIRIASIVVGLIVYCGVWNYIIDNFEDSVLYQIVFMIWIVLHVVGIVTAVVWAWC